MQITEQSLTGSFEQKRELVSQFNLFHDIFFSVIMQDKGAAEYVLQQCTGIPDLQITASNPQNSFNNLFGKESILDFYAEDSTHHIYNIEVQNLDDDRYFGPLRARYYQAALDTALFQKGHTYDELFELYIIFITPFNPLKEFGRASVVYEKKCTLDGIEWDNKVHEIYLNAEVIDNTPLSAMLQYFKTADPSDMRFGSLSNAVHRQKETEKGVFTMCKAVEDYANSKKNEGRAEGKLEAKIEVVQNLLTKGFTLLAALEVAGIDEETYKLYQ